MHRFLVGVISSAAAALLGCSAKDRTASEVVDPKYKEISTLPVGLKVTHTPNPVKARRGGRSGAPYTWMFGTSVESLGETVSITEFGAFIWSEGRWCFTTFTGVPFTAEDFSDWYSCPDARVVPGQKYTDPVNWGGGDELQPGKTLWYYIGVTRDGKRVKGAAVVEELGALAKTDGN